MLPHVHVRYRRPRPATGRNRPRRCVPPVRGRRTQRHAPMWPPCPARGIGTRGDLRGIRRRGHRNP
jgi:hypothetical protein